MAAALFNAAAPAGWRAGSAGTEPGERVRPEAVEAMREVGLDISAHRPTALAAALSPDVALVVGLCAEEPCPVVPGVRSEHWPLPNPAGGGLARYRAVRDELARRVRTLAETLAARGTGA
jgi:arsenate reductase